MKDLFNNEPMRALSWKEPFASLMLEGKIETRKWNTKYRGLVLICASKGSYSYKDLAEISDEPSLLYTMGKLSQFKGVAMAVGTLYDCRPMKKEDAEKAHVKFNPDLFCHFYKDVKPIKCFHWDGVQRWKKVTQEIINQIEFI